MKLVGKRALVTGGAVRLGRCICEMLAARGCDIVIHCHRSVAEAESLASGLEARGVRAMVVHGDLAVEADCERIVREAIAALGSIDILVNNASVFNKDPFMQADGSRLSEEIAVNALAPMSLVRAFARQPHLQTGSGMPLSPAGAVVNLLDRRVSSIEKGMLPYLLSKKMLADYTRIAALELGPRISVNAVAPGPVLPPPGRGEDYLHDHAGAMVLGRRPTPEDVATAALFLIEADTVTGQILYVDSGQHLL